MIVGVVKETFPGERRVALVPDIVPPLKKKGFEVVIEKGAGLPAGYPDEAYEAKGASLLGSREEVGRYALDERIGIAWLEDGDHDLKPRKRSGETVEGHLEAAAQVIREFVEAR